MKAAVSDRYGAPEVVRIRDIPRPKPGPRDILIRVQATTVSRTDCGLREPHPFFIRLSIGLFRPRHHVLGMDFAGIVEEVGGEVETFRTGDRVFGLSPARYGAHAEYLLLTLGDPVEKIPDGLTAPETVVCEGAWYANSTISTAEPGQAILVYGASGAIGTAAVQLAKARGLEVTAVVGTRHLDLARSLGADHVVDYTAKDFTDTEQRFDIVYDAVGKTSYFACRKLLKPEGRFCACDLGPYWSNIWLSHWSGLTGSGRVSIPMPKDAPGLVRMIRDLLAAGEFRAVIDRHYPLARIVDGYAYVETQSKTGIVVIDVD